MQALSRTTSKAPLPHSPCARSRPHRTHFLRPPHPSSVGSKAGHVPVDIEPVTDLERLPLLGQLHRVDVFNMGPLFITEPGIIEDPTLVPDYVCDGS